MNFYAARVSPDGAWLIVEGRPNGANQMALYRVGIGGGVPQRLFDVADLMQFWCPHQPTNFCVFGTTPLGKNELVVTSFDPVGTNVKERLRIPLEPGTSAAMAFDYSWQLSPDGSRIAVAKRNGNQIRLVPLNGGPTETITIKGYSDLAEVSWAMDSQSLFVSTMGPGGITVLNVDRRGRPQPIWQRSQTSGATALSSPDGRHLATVGVNAGANAWMISNF
jgi:hypothetical protein